MNKWLLVSQLGVAATAALVFLSLVADGLQYAEADLDARKEAWDQEQRRKREQELEAMVAEVADVTVRPQDTKPVPEITPEQ